MARTLADAIGGTVRQRATRELRDRILTGTLPAGTRLDLDAISREFGISRTPVREALLELSVQGLVTVAPRSGVTVLGVTPDQALDNFSIFAALSGKAAELAAQRITPGALTELALHAEDLTGRAGSVEANWRFHSVINVAAGSAHLLSLIRQAVRLIPSNFLAVVPVHTDDDDEHAQLLALVRRGRPTQARAVAERHVQKAGTALVEWLSEQDASVG
jgi:DNA-binding GntR family transcriptional regulator